MRFRVFIESYAEPGYAAAVSKGKAREERIANALRSKYPIETTKAGEDIRGVDAYIKIKGRVWATQIKTIGSHEALFFHLPMTEKAELFVFVSARNLTAYFIPANEIKKVLDGLHQQYQRFRKAGMKVRIVYKGVDWTIEERYDNLNRKNLVASAPDSAVDLFNQIEPPFKLPPNTRI